MHAFLLGDEGPEYFETVKSVIARALEEKYYPSFLVSDIYYSFVSQISSDEIAETENVKVGAVMCRNYYDRWTDRRMIKCYIGCRSPLKRFDVDFRSWLRLNQSDVPWATTMKTALTSTHPPLVSLKQIPDPP